MCSRRLQAPFSTFFFFCVFSPPSLFPNNAMLGERVKQHCGSEVVVVVERLLLTMTMMT